MNINNPSWLTETSLTPYPLVKSFGYDSFLIDAALIQFDNFIPTLKTIKCVDNHVILTLVLDLYTKSFSIPKADILTIGSTYKLVVDSRYIGRLTFGSGVEKLIAAVGDNTTLKVETKFLAHIVRSIPSKCGVFAINSLFGDLQFTHGDHITYTVDSLESDTIQHVTFNAIAVPPPIDIPYLKTLNSVGPTHNSVFLKSTDLIKVAGQASTIEVSLVGGTSGAAAISDAIIVTSDDNA